MYMWILSTGWWKSRAPINPDAVFIISILCTTLIGGFIYINKFVSAKFHPVKHKGLPSFRLLIYSTFCLIFSQSKAPEVIEKTVSAILDTAPDSRKLVLPLVREPDLPDYSSSSSCWWRGWSWSSRFSWHLFFLPTFAVHFVHEPKGIYWLGWTASSLARNSSVSLRS